MMSGNEGTRFDSPGYINWVKACYCLKLLKGGLHPFVRQQMEGFLRELLDRKGGLRQPCENNCTTRGTTFPSPCGTCLEWRKAIQGHHRQQNKVIINWGNCSPPRWRKDDWELAKAYMPPGYSGVKTIEECDASGLLNLIAFCDRFQSFHVHQVREVVRCRNKLMHSDFNVEEAWMTAYRSSLRSLVQQFSHAPEMEAAGREIEEVLNARLSLHMTDGIETDTASSPEVDVEVIRRWEAEFLQETLQELLRAAAAGHQDDSETQDVEGLKALVSFLRANTDLSEAFSAELQVIGPMEREDGRAQK